MISRDDDSLLASTNTGAAADGLAHQVTRPPSFRGQVGLQAVGWSAFLAITLGLSFAAYTVRYRKLGFGADTWVHLALVRRTLTHGWFSGDAFYADTGTPPYYSLSHIVLAIFSQLSGVSPHDLWIALPPFAAAGILVATFAYLRVFTGSVVIAAFGAAGEMLLTIPYDPIWGVPLFPRALALLPRALALLCHVRACRSERRVWLFGCGVALAACFATHLFMGIFCLLSLLLLECASNVGRLRPTARVLVPGILGPLLSSPWLINLVLRWHERQAHVPELFDPSRPLFRQEVWSAAFGDLTVSMYRPAGLLHAMPLSLWFLTLVGLAQCLGRVWNRTAGSVERYALLSTAVTGVLLLTPVFGLLLALGGVWTTRMVQVVPFALLIGLGCDYCMRTISRFGERSWKSRTAALGALFGFLAAVWLASHGVLALMGEWSRIGVFFEHGPLANWQLEADLKQRGLRAHTILSDPLTSYLLPYYLGAHVVAIPAEHGSAYLDHQRRALDVSKVFNPRTSIAELRRVLDEYQVDALAIPTATVWFMPQRFNAMALQGPRLVRRLRTQPSFEEIGAHSDLVFFRYRGSSRAGPRE
jgi:hypothetical protein